MAYPTYVGAGTMEAKASSATVRAYYPAGSVDDIVIAVAYNGYSGNYSTPAGWTMKRDINGWAVAWKRATSTSASSVSFAAASSVGFQMGVGYRFGSCDETNSPTDGARNNSGSGWSVVSGGTVISTKDTSLMVWVGAVDDNVAANNDATYFTERNEQQTAIGTDGMMALYTYQQATAGSVASDSYSIGALSGYVCTAFALKPYSYPQSVIGVTSANTDKILSFSSFFTDKVVGV
jgi:hypothetical protein